VLNGEPKDKLPDLPSSRSKFWNKADKHSVQLNEPKECKHFFIRRMGREIVCEKCSIGFYADQNTEVKEGKIYYRGKHVI